MIIINTTVLYTAPFFNCSIFFPWSVLHDIFFLHFCCAGFFFGNFPTPPSKIKWSILKENQNITACPPSIFGNFVRISSECLVKGRLDTS